MNKFFLKRFLAAASLGALSGLLCTYLASSKLSTIWGSALMWSMVFNRFLIGALIGMLGVYKIHPILRFKLFPAVRGFFIGVIISIQIGIGIFIGGLRMSKELWILFFMTLLAGGIYGMIIDLVVTKFIGDGKDLLK